MGKKYLKQIAVFMLVFALIFQNSATLLMVVATSSNESTTEEETVAEEETSVEEEAPVQEETPAQDEAPPEEEAVAEEETPVESTTEDTPQAESTTQSTSQQEATTATDSSTETTYTESSTQEVGEKTVVIDGVTYNISDGFSQEQIPAYFSLTTLEYNGNTVTAVKFDNGDIYLLYLVEEGAYTGGFYVYDQESKNAYPFQTIGEAERYLMLLNTPEKVVVPEGFAETSMFLEGTTLLAYRFNGTITKTEESGNTYDEDKETSSTEETTSEMGTSSSTPSSILSSADFYLVYGMNSKGYEGWFQYDAGEGTYLRYVSYESTEETVDPEELAAVQKELEILNEKYENEMKKRIFIISGLIILAFILIIIITSLIFKVKDLKRNDDWDDDEDDDDWNDDYDYKVDDEDCYNSDLDSKNKKEKPDAVVDNALEEDIEERAPKPIMPSDITGKNSVQKEDIVPSVEINSQDAMLDESELAREVAKAMNGEQRTLANEEKAPPEDNFDFEFVDLD